MIFNENTCLFSDKKIRNSDKVDEAKNTNSEKKQNNRSTCLFAK